MSTLLKNANCGVQTIIGGTFLGDDIEPGTFHYLPPDMIPGPDTNSSDDPEGSSSSEGGRGDESQLSACLA